MPGTSTTRIVAGVIFRACSIAATCGSRSSAIGAIPTCSLRSCSCAPAWVSALKSEVFPESARPTMPTSRAIGGSYAPKPTRPSRAKRFTYTILDSATV